MGNEPSESQPNISPDDLVEERMTKTWLYHELATMSDAEDPKIRENLQLLKDREKALKYLVQEVGELGFIPDSPVRKKYDELSIEIFRRKKAKNPNTTTD